MEKTQVMQTSLESAGFASKQVNRLNRIILLAALAIILNAIFNHFVIDATRPKTTLKVGDRFPAFSLKSMDGAIVSDKGFSGKPTIYYFFANWCPCAHDTIKWIKKMQAENGQSRLAILGVGILDSSEGITSFARKHNLGFPVVTENGGGLAQEAGMETTPTTVFVDGEGVIRYVHIGKIERYEQALEGLRALGIG